MARTYELRVRLDDEVAAKLERFATGSIRNLTQSVNLLLGAALEWVDIAGGLDALMSPPKDEK